MKPKRITEAQLQALELSRKMWQVLDGESTTIKLMAMKDLQRVILRHVKMNYSEDFYELQKKVLIKQIYQI